MIINLNNKQLKVHLSKELNSIYLLLGNDSFLIQENYNIIRKEAFKHDFKENFTFQVNDHTNWARIFSLCQTISIFSKRQIIRLFLPENGINNIINSYLIKLVNLLHNDMILIICGINLNKDKGKNNWINKIPYKIIKVFCSTPVDKNLLYWVMEKAREKGIQLENESYRLLCYSYEGNLASLSQVLDKISLLRPNNKIFSLKDIKSIVNDSAHFKPSQLIDAILAGNGMRAIRIIQYLALENKELIYLLNVLELEVILLIKLKRQLNNITLDELFIKFSIWKNRQTLVTKALYNINDLQLFNAIKILNCIKKMLRQNYNHQLAWSKLKYLSLILCSTSQ